MALRDVYMSQPLTTEEAIELLALSVDNINQQFELWLTITFAVIVASYIAGHKLSQVFRVWFVTLYLMVSILLFLMLRELRSYDSNFDCTIAYAIRIRNFGSFERHRHRP